MSVMDMIELINQQAVEIEKLKVQVRGLKAINKVNLSEIQRLQRVLKQEKAK